MADAFRGLTLKIGADARPVNSALQSIRTQASAAQKQISAMNKALKFDGTNAAALASKLDLVRDKASLSASAAAKVGTAIRQAASRTVEFSDKSRMASGRLEDVAAKTAEVYSEVQRVNAAYNTTNAQLQRIYDASAKVAGRYSNLKDSDALAVTVARLKQISNSAAVAYLADLRARTMGAGDAAKEADAEYKALFSRFTDADAIEYIKRLRSAQDSSTEAGRKAKAELEGYIKDAAGLKSVYEAFGVQKNKGAELLGIYRELRASHGAYQNDLAALKEVEGFRALSVQAVAYKSEVAEAGAETAKTRLAIASLGTTGSLARLLSDVKGVTAASELAASNARRIADAYALVPTNAAVANAKILSMAQAEAAADHELERIKAALDEIRNDSAFDIQAANSREAYIEAQRVESEYADLETRLRLAKGAADELNAQLDAMKGGDAKKASAEVRQLEAELSDAERECRELRAQMDAMEKSGRVAVAGLVTKYHELTVAEAEAASRVARLREETNRLEKTFGDLRTMGYGVYSTITPLIMMAARYSVQAANDVDSAYRNMRKTVNGSEDDFERLRDSALAFSRTHFTSADEILEIEAIGGQLGVSVENLEKFAEVVSNLDIATNLDKETISENLGQLSNIMKDMDQDLQSGPGSMEAFSDALVRLGNNSATQEDKIMAVMMRIGSMGTIMGMTTDQLLALSTAVAASGQGSEAAGTAISKTFSNIESAVSNGGDKLAMFAEISGMSANEFSSAWSTSPMEAFSAFIAGLRDIDDAGGSVDGTLRDLGINSVRQKQTLMNLTTQVDVLNDALLMSHDAWYGISDEWGDAGDAAREAGRKAEGFSGQLQMLFNSAEGLGVMLLDGLVPALKSITRFVQNTADAVSALPDWMKTMIVETGALVALSGPALIAVGALGSGFSKLMKAIEHAKGIMVFNRQLKALNASGATAERKMAVMKTRIAELAGAEHALTGAQRAELSALRANTAAMESGKKAAGGLKTALKGLAGGLGATLALEGVLALVTALGEFVEKSRQFREATKGLEESVEGFQKAAEAAGGAPDAIADTTAAYGSLRREAAAAVDEAVSKNIEMAESVQKARTEAEGSAAATGIYADRLKELNGACDGSAEKLAAEKQWLDEFNAATGLSVSVVNDLTGELSMNNDEIDRSIELLRKRTYAEGIKSVAENASRTVAEYDVQIREFEDRLADLKAAQDGYDEWEIQSGKPFADMVEMFQIENDIADLYKLRESAAKTADAAMDEYESTVIDAANAEKDLAATSKDMADALAGVDEDAEAAAEELEALYQTFDNLVDEFPALDRMLDESGVGADEFIALLDGMGLSMEDVRSSMNGMVDAVTDGFNKIDYESGTSLEKYLENLRNNKEVTEDWGDNLQRLYERVGDNDVAREWIASLAELGPSQALIIDQLVDAADEDLVRWANEWKEGSDIGVEAFLQSLGYGTEEATIMMHNLGDTIDALNDLGIKFTVTDDGTIKVAKDQLDSLDEEKLRNKGFEVTDNGTVTRATAKVEELSGEVEGIPPHVQVKVDAATEAARSQLSTLSGQVQYLMRNRTINVVASVSTILSGGKNAKGGILPAYKSGAVIPKHANGALNGIAIKPMLTNIGWVGEDGAEAILNMRNAGGAVVPLTNKRYVRPFANAVASEMAPAYTNGFGGSSEVYNIYLDDVRVNDNEAMRAATKEYLLEMKRLAAI